MKSLIRLIYIALFLNSIALMSQDLPSNPEIGNQIPQLDIPAQYGSDIMNSTQLSGFSMAVCSYNSDTINLDELRKMYPLQDLPKELIVKPPEWIKKHEDIHAWVGLSNPESNPDLFIILIGDYFGRKVSYYIDEDLDLDFSENKVETIHFREKSKSINVSIRKGEFFTLKLKNNFREEIKRMTGSSSFFYENRHIEDQFYIEFNGTIGPGELVYNYDNLEFGFPSWYDVSFVSRGVGIGFGYDMNVIGIGLNLKYQNIGYYTSYTNNRKGERELVQVSGGTVVRENVETERNLEINPNHLLELSLQLRYNLNLSETIRLQPTVDIGSMQFFPNDFVPDRRTPEIGYSLSNTMFYELGIRAEFSIGKGKDFYIGYGYNNVIWNPDGFVNSLNQSDYESSYNISKMMVGYRIGI